VSRGDREHLSQVDLGTLRAVVGKDPQKHLVQVPVIEKKCKKPLDKSLKV
jgi:hypothetical protein